MDMLPGLHTDRDYFVYIDGMEYNLNSFDEDKIKIVINKINDNLDAYIDYCEKELINGTKKDKNKEICNNIIEINNKTIDDLSIVVTTKSSQFLKLLTKIYVKQYELSLQLASHEGLSVTEALNDNIKELEASFDKIKNLSKFDIISESNDNEIIIFGANGAGKSSFVSFIKNVYYDEMIVIPAQKVLIYDENKKDYSINESSVNELQHANTIEQLRNSYCNIDIIASSFSRLISAVVNKTTYEQNEYFEKSKEIEKNGKDEVLKRSETLLDKINDVFSKVIPNIEFKIDIEHHCIYPEKFNQKYTINSMSDGEKAILSYISNVLLAAPHSYIVIDEPETYLNPAIYSKLWDSLREARPDCQFIYVSHDIDFIRSRKDIKLIWMKSYIHPDMWNFTILEDNDDLPKDLLVEVLGSNKKVLFCEGTSSRYDAEIYDILFSDNYKIVPVEGCNEVCKYTKAYNSCPYIDGNGAIGIVDNDGRSEEEIENLKKDAIYATEFNEIEMLLCDDDILNCVIEDYSPKEGQKKKEEFVNLFFDEIKKYDKKIAMNFVSQKMNWMFANYRLTSRNIEEIEPELERLKAEVDFMTDYKNRIKEVDDIVTNKDYQGLLKICNLKEQIILGIGNKVFKDYPRRAIGVIRTKLGSKMREKYFSELN